MKRWAVSLLLSFALTFTGCMQTAFPRHYTELGQLADVHSAREEKVLFLQENDDFVPYYVVTDQYGENPGQTLLLRQDILPDFCVFSETDNAYYAESNADKVLNGEFYQSLAQPVRELISDTEIEICCKFPDTSSTKMIKRKIFLLSATEVQIEMQIVLPEGSPLPFFEKNAHHIAQCDGHGAAWWLRSAYTMDRGLAWQIGAAGTVGGNAIQFEAGLRPAFCIPSQTPIVRQQISEEAEGYVLQLPE